MSIHSIVIQKYYDLSASHFQRSPWLYLFLLLPGYFGVAPQTLALGIDSMSATPAINREAKTHPSSMSPPQLLAGQIPPRSNFRGNGQPLRPPYYDSTYSVPYNPVVPLGTGTRFNRLYWVYVNGNSPYLLELVQDIEPAALVRSYQEQAVIDAGAFINEISAKQRVQQLKSRGIEAHITSIQNVADFGDQPYYVPPVQAFVVPSTTSLLPALPYVPMLSPHLAPVSPIAAIGSFSVYADSSSGLAVIQQIDPNAREVSIGNRIVIYAGSFATEFEAQQRVQVLSSYGVAAEIMRTAGQGPAYVPNQSNFYPNPTYTAPFQNYVPSTALPYFTPSPVYAPPPQAAFAPLQNYPVPNYNYYFVVVPGEAANLTSLAAQVTQLGVPTYAIFPRQIPGDPHVAVGPFSSEEAAKRWESFLQKSGVGNTRIYFGH